MVRILYLVIIVGVVLSSCKSDDNACCFSYAEFPRIKVLDKEDSVDLLNPDNAFYFDHSEINLWTLVDSNKREIDFIIQEAFYGDYHILAQDIEELMLQEGYQEYFLSLKPSMVDTFSLVVEDHGQGTRSRDYKLNGEKWTEYDSLDGTNIIWK